MILDDADLTAAVGYGVANCYLNSRPDLQRPHPDAGAAREAGGGRADRRGRRREGDPGDPFEDGTRLGPLVSEAQRERVRGYIEKGEEEGAKLVTGGAEPPEGLDSGYFVRPTVFSDVKPDMTIAQEEIFGPVLSIIPYEDEDEAARSRTRPSTGWTAASGRPTPSGPRRSRGGCAPARCRSTARTFNPLAPFGGYKQSGNGREIGRFGLEEFLEVKSIQCSCRCGC